MLKLISLLLCVGFASSTAVIELTDANFADKVSQQSLMLVKFYAPWCGHCKRMAPEFDTASLLLVENDPPVALGKLDCTVETKTCAKFGVSGYPTLKLFRSDPETGEEYNGPRESDGIVKFMRSKAGPTSKNLESVESFENFLSKSEIAIVGFFDGESQLRKEFMKLADAMSDNFRFAHTEDKSVSENSGYSNSVVLYRPKFLSNKFETGFVKYEGTADFSTMKHFVNTHAQGLCGHRTPGNSDQFQQPLVVAYYEVDYVKNTKGTNYWRNRVLKVATELNKAGVSVNYAISNRKDFSHELSEFGVEAPSEKPVIAAKDSQGRKFVMQGEFSMPSLKEFVTELAAGKLEPYMKSEPIPENNEPVKVAVGRNFEELVNDDSKDVLIEFYAPWCGHCKSLVPIYDEVAKKLENEPNLVIAKMDATANDVPKQYEVKGFPTLYFARAGQKMNPMKYESGRDVDSFIKFLARESTEPLLTYDRDGKKQKNTEL